MVFTVALHFHKGQTLMWNFGVAEAPPEEHDKTIWRS
jgi:hypothetical protein